MKSLKRSGITPFALLQVNCFALHQRRGSGVVSYHECYTKQSATLQWNTQCAHVAEEQSSCKRDIFNNNLEGILLTVNCAKILYLNAIQKHS